MNTPETTIRKIYDHLYANHTSKTPSGIGKEVGKILHTAMYLEEIKGVKPSFNFDSVEAAKLLNLDSGGRKDYANFIKETFNEMNNKWNLYEKQDKINLSDYDICYSCVQLSGIQVSDKKTDVLGDAAEVFRSEWAKRLGGQFFTNAQITKLAVNLLEFNPTKGDDLVDICAGTGGFLFAGLNHIEYLAKDSKKGFGEKEIIHIARNSLKGIELDVEVCSVANSTLKARLGTNDGEMVKIGNSLEVERFRNDKAFVREGTHKCAATNPPFGTKISVKDPNILKNFELAVRNRNNKKVIVPTPPDILLLEQNIRLLIPGEGKLAIVLPYQLLSGPQTSYIRKWLLLHTKILAIIDLPIEAFQPYTGTKTSLLVVQRKSKPEEMVEDSPDYEIFMASPKWIGHDRRGNQIFNKDGTEILCDINEVISAFEFFKKKGNPNEVYSQCFAIKYNDVIKDPLLRLNVKFSRPVNLLNENKVPSFKSPEWKTVKLRELVKDIFYPGRFKRSYIDPSPSAVPFLGGADINEFVLRTNKWLSPNDPKIDELRVRKGWILITRSGTTGLISSVPEAWEGYAISEHVIRIVPDENKVEPEYLLAILQSGHIQRVLAKGVYGSVIDEINPDYIGDMDIPVPKSKIAYNKIVQMLKEAEVHRHLGILSYNGAIEKMNQVLSS